MHKTLSSSMYVCWESSTVSEELSSFRMFSSLRVISTRFCFQTSWVLSEMDIVGHLLLTPNQFLVILIGWLNLWNLPIILMAKIQKNNRMSLCLFSVVILPDSCWKVTLLTFMSYTVRNMYIFYLSLAGDRWRQDFQSQVVRHFPPPTTSKLL